jgi:hypothetical protein
LAGFDEEDDVEMAAAAMAVLFSVDTSSSVVVVVVVVLTIRRVHAVAAKRYCPVTARGSDCDDATLRVNEAWPTNAVRLARLLHVAAAAVAI